MGSTDFFDGEVDIPIENVARVGAKKRESLFIAHLCPEVFQANSCGGEAGLPEEHDHLTERADPSAAFTSAAEKIVYDLLEEDFVGPTSHHKLG
jgi:hypothetical protein